MGRIGNSAKRVPRSIGLFIKFQDGDKLRMRILSEPRVRATQYSNDKEPTFDYIFEVWDYTNEKVRMLSQGIAGAEAIDEMNDEWGEEYPAKFDLTIKATGAGKNGRKYTRTSSPQLGTMPQLASLERLEWAKVAPGAITVTQHEQGMDPEIQERQSAEDPDGSKPPSAEQYAAARAAQDAEEQAAINASRDSDDVIPADVPEGGPNLDEIPF
jgi:hypothetical protein